MHFSICVSDVSIALRDGWVNRILAVAYGLDHQATGDLHICLGCLEHLLLVCIELKVIALKMHSDYVVVCVLLEAMRVEHEPDDHLLVGMLVILVHKGCTSLVFVLFTLFDESLVEDRVEIDGIPALHFLVGKFIQYPEYSFPHLSFVFIHAFLDLGEGVFVERVGQLLCVDEGVNALDFGSQLTYFASGELDLRDPSASDHVDVLDAAQPQTPVEGGGDGSAFKFFGGFGQNPADVDGCVPLAYHHSLVDVAEVLVLFGTHFAIL
eukprot:CAMPEP_0116959762 /NCGR_PEP_ID=MMETSP0467-20121206/45526_1 /TAXON_ID=283647 /ORGANISM="Mesodinium pulex, Strain SPMC105" /LENGTH=265 /DNA_ID=CAMNT_0004647297 /DNA_START=309 /DNA_END=1106 /DNA_ORIENTATION=-